MKALKVIDTIQDNSPFTMQNSCCADNNRAPCGEGLEPETKDLPGWISGTISTPIGLVKKISTVWTARDHWGNIKSRMSSFRMHYSVEPGLYAVGNPDKNSDIFVSANYKLSFDILRRALRNLNAWVLVLDTKGINVWCAAGKGTFGTDELIWRIAETGIEKLVKHRRIIVPQLGAPGIASGEVKKRAGFRVYFGPVDAADINLYVKNSYHATRGMRTIKFTMLDRMILTPMELIPALKRFPLFALIILIIFGLQPAGVIFRDAVFEGAPFLLAGLFSVFSGAFITPLLLPFIPFRSFAIKGWIIGITALALLTWFTRIFDFNSAIPLITVFLFFPLLSSYIALQFTGATTFTGISGVKKELRIGLPVYLSGLLVSSILMIIHKLIQWGMI
jgi:hypothetical protein